MTVGTGGVEYENTVLSVIKPQIKKIPKMSLRASASTAAFAATEPDIVIMYNGQQVNIEVKQDAKAQMGGGSYNYDMLSKTFSLSAKTVIDPSIDRKIKDILESKAPELDRLLRQAKKKDVKVLSEQVSGLPLKAAKSVWEDLTKQGFLIPLNSKIDVPYSFLHDHYAKKSCFYIQIGGAGLFYLKRNPLKLPIPQLKIPMAIELRVGRAGSKLDKGLGIEVATGNIRAQGRLDSKKGLSSPYSLDRPGDLLELFGNIKKK